MKREDLLRLKRKYLELSKEEEKQRHIYLRDIANGTKQGPMLGYPEEDMPWLKNYTDEQIMADVPEILAYDNIKEANKENLDSIALNFMGTEISYRQLFKNIDKCIKAFTNEGVKEGDMVTFCTPTTPETIYMFYALNYLGAIANFVDLRTNKERIIEYINNAESKLVISSDVVLKKVDGLLDETCAEKIINADTSTSLPYYIKPIYKFKTRDNKVISEKVETYKDFIKGGKDVEFTQKAEYDPNKIAAIVYTGGTTGIPKGAQLTNKNLNSVIHNYRNSGMKRNVGETFVDIMPPFIAYGLVVGIHLPLMCGFKNVIIPKFDPEDVGKTLNKYKPEHYIGVPTHFEYMMKDPKLKNADMSYVQNYGVGGDSLNPRKEKDINDFLESHGSKNKLRIGYGMTENSSATITNVNNECTKIGSIGVPLINNNVMIKDPETGENLMFNQSGEIYLTGDQIMHSYLKNEEETKKVIVTDEFGRKWVKSGDIGYMDQDGNVFIESRIKNMIVRPDGHNVFPLNVAAVLGQDENVDEVAVVGIKSKYGYEGTIPTAYVVLKEGIEPSEETKKEILEFQSHYLPERDGALDVRFVEKLPETPIGKIDVKRLADEASLSDIDFDELAQLKGRNK